MIKLHVIATARTFGIILIPILWYLLWVYICDNWIGSFFAALPTGFIAFCICGFANELYQEQLRVVTNKYHARQYAKEQRLRDLGVH